MTALSEPKAQQKEAVSKTGPADLAQPLVASQGAILGMPLFLRGRSAAAAAAGRHPDPASMEFPYAGWILRSVGVPASLTCVRDELGCNARGVPAFTDGSLTHFSSGSPALHVAAHEAAHLLQHAGLTRDAGLGPEGHAGAVADAVAEGRSAAPFISNRGDRVPSASRNYNGIFPSKLNVKPPRSPADIPMRLSPWAEKFKSAEHTYEMLKIYYIRNGEEGLNELGRILDQETGPESASPQERAEILSNYQSQRKQLIAYRQTYLSTFENTAKAHIATLLKASEDKINEEMERYGIQEIWKDDAANKAHVRTGKYTVSPTDDTKELADTARSLIGLYTHMANTKIQADQRLSTWRKKGPMEQASAREEDRKRIEADPEVLAAVQAYDEAFKAAVAKFPILAAFRDNPRGFSALTSLGSSPAAATLIGKELEEKRKNIQETRENLDSGELSIWPLKNIVDGTKALLKAAPASIEAKFVDEYQSGYEMRETAFKTVMAALSIASGIVAAVATGGGSLLVAAAATGVGTGIGLINLVETLEHYSVHAPASDTDLDKARSISQEDPSFIWVAIALLSVGLDVFAATRMFGPLRGPLSRALEARRLAAAAEAAGESGEEAAKAVAAADEALDQVLKGIPEKAANQIRARVQTPKAVVVKTTDPKMSTAGYAGSNPVPGTGVFLRKIPGVEGNVAVKVYAPGQKTAFVRDVKAAQAASDIGVGPKFRGVVEVVDEAGNKRLAFVVDEVKGSMVDPANASPAAVREAAEAAGRVTQQTVDDATNYGQQILDKGYYIDGEVQGLVDHAGRWRAIDIHIERLPDPVLQPQDYAYAMSKHNNSLGAEIDLLKSNVKSK